ncbi:MAG: hypothetical protein OEV66_10430 [Spirochaetia bacterium]|nr:hypothetical protein [Spirochaetia bacterium]
MFPDTPPFTFNVSFSCADPKTRSYTNPDSHWFNVFFGYYEIDALAKDWKRPFGYESNSSTVKIDEVLRLGKSDWNYFSNYMYGVPESHILPLNGPDPDTTYTIEKVKIGSKVWDKIVINHITVVSAFMNYWRSYFPYNNNIFSPIVRAVYGKPYHYFAPFGNLENFFPVKVTAIIYMSQVKMKDPYFKNKEIYKTYMMGGTINEHYSNKGEAERQFNQEFLEAQNQSIIRFLQNDFKG